jgi:hypothetical protein
MLGFPHSFFPFSVKKKIHQAHQVMQKATAQESYIAQELLDIGPTHVKYI